MMTIRAYILGNQLKMRCVGFESCVSVHPMDHTGSKHVSIRIRVHQAFKSFMSCRKNLVCYAYSIYYSELLLKEAITH